MSLKLLMHALERASLEYANTGNLHARARALQLIDELRDALNRVEDLLCSLPEPIPEEAL